MFSLAKMRDKAEQQRRGRPDGAIRPAVDRRSIGKDPAPASETGEMPEGWTTASERSQSPRRHFVDSAQRRSLVRSARRISLFGHLLASPATACGESSFFELHIFAKSAGARSASGLCGPL